MFTEKNFCWSVKLRFGFNKIFMSYKSRVYNSQNDHFLSYKLILALLQYSDNLFFQDFFSLTSTITSSSSANLLVKFPILERTLYAK